MEAIGGCGSAMRLKTSRAVTCRFRIRGRTTAGSACTCANTLPRARLPPPSPSRAGPVSAATPIPALTTAQGNQRAAAAEKPIPHQHLVC